MIVDFTLYPDWPSVLLPLPTSVFNVCVLLFMFNPWDVSGRHLTLGVMVPGHGSRSLNLNAVCRALDIVLTKVWCGFLIVLY